MKTIRYFAIIACAAAVAASCMKDELKDNVYVEPIFTAVREDFGGPASKTMLTDNYKVVWCSGDEVGVFDGSVYPREGVGSGSQLVNNESGWEYGLRFKTTDNGASAGFAYEAYDAYKDEEPEVYAPGAADSYLLIHPMAVNFIANVSEGKFRAWLSNSQKAEAGTYDSARGFAVAKTSDLSEPVRFKNAVTLMEFVIPDSMLGKVKTIKVTPAGSNKNIAGDLLIDYSGADVVTSPWGSTAGESKTPKTDVTLTPKSGTAFASGKYYMVVCPGTYDVITVEATLTSGMVLKRESSKGPYTFKPGYVYGMGEIGMNYSAPDLSAELVATSSSSLVFTWTHGGNAAIDAAQPYEFALYEDAQCTKEVIKHISDSNSATAVWADVQPKFVFAGLAQDTQYYFKVSNTESKRSSAVIPAKTDKFTIVHNRTEEAGLGDVILAEDFSECVSGGESGLGAAGAKFGGAFKPAVSENFVGFAKYDADPYNQGLKNLTGISDTRLHTWGYCQLTSGGNVYPHASSVKIGTGSHKSAIVTPVLAAIPDGKVAKVLVKTTVSMRHDLSSLKVMAVALRGNLTDKKLNEYDTVASADYTISEKGKLFELEFALDGVTNDCRVMIGPHTDVANGKGRMYINDITVTVTGLSDLQ